jgi:chondroitin AC lyase
MLLNQLAMKPFFIFLLLLIATFSVNANSQTDSILSRYRQYYLKDIRINDVDSYVAKFINDLNEKKQWPDINYADTSPAYWQTRMHLERIINLSIAWTNSSSQFYHKADVWQTISNALDHWLEMRYQNSNWWVNEIGVPQNMRDVLILIRQQLTPLQLKQALEVLAQHKVRGVGANLIWSADLSIHYGAMVKNEELIDKSAQLIAKEIRVSTGEGIQPDYSYHQHDERLQIYHYGSSFLRENVRLAWELRNTKWALPTGKINILTDFIVQGWQWMSRGINTVPGTIDRAASRQDQLHNADIRGLVPFLNELNPAFAKNFTAIANRQNGLGTPLNGFRYFPYSDFSAYHHNEFSFFIKTISTRTLPSESINTENLKGRLLNNGDAYFIKNGNEYFNVLPAWNWNFLPAQTNINSDKDTISRSPFAGSVTDGKTGLTALDYAVIKGEQRITAHKFWACYDNVVVCLIANLQTANVTDSLYTALDQARLQGKVEVNKAGNFLKDSGTYHLENVKWIYHNNAGYINLVPASIKLELDIVNSSWSTINASASTTITREKVFRPLLYHPPAKNFLTGYVLAACKDANAVQRLADNPIWKVVRNDSVCQAASFKDRTLMCAFYSAGAVVFNRNKMIQVDKACLMQINNSRIFVSDPLHKGGIVTIKLSGKVYNVKMNSDGTTTSVAYKK